MADNTVQVRRKCYPPSSPAGKGAKWECAASEHSTEWHTFDMDIQCLIEEAWARVSFFFLYFCFFYTFFTFYVQGDQTIDISKTHLGFPYVINFSNLTLLTSGYVRSVRRVKQAPYPLVKVKLEELATVTGKQLNALNLQKLQQKNCLGRRNCELRKSSRTMMVQNCNQSSKCNTFNLNETHKKQASGNKKKSKTNNETTPSNLARQLLQNLNIFSMS